jgi:hypothetical protein
MAVKDPKARRSAVNYLGGRVTGAIGLLEYLFGSGAASQPVVIKLDKRGRRRASGLLNKTSAIGGKQLIIDTKSGETYQLHYSGALVDWIAFGVPLLDRSKVNGWSTARGKKRYL